MTSQIVVSAGLVVLRVLQQRECRSLRGPNRLERRCNASAAPDAGTPAFTVSGMTSTAIGDDGKLTGAFTGGRGSMAAASRTS